MVRKYSCKRSLRNKRRNGLFPKKSAKTNKFHGGRGGAGGLGGRNETLPSANPLSTIGGKRGIPIDSSLHRNKTRKNRRH